MDKRANPSIHPIAALRVISSLAMEIKYQWNNHLMQYRMPLMSVAN